MKKQMTVSDILLLVGGFVVLICFFLPWSSDAYDYLYGPQTGLGFATVASSKASGMPGLTYFIIPLCGLIILAMQVIHLFGIFEIKNKDRILLIVAIVGILPFIQLIIEFSKWTAAYAIRYGLVFAVLGALASLSGAMIKSMKKG